MGTFQLEFYESPFIPARSNVFYYEIKCGRWNFMIYANFWK